MLSLVLQVFFLIMGAGMLDGGEIFQIVIYAIIAYWVGFVLVFMRRCRGLTKADKLLIKWGFPILCFLSGSITGFIWHLRGF